MMAMLGRLYELVKNIAARVRAWLKSRVTELTWDTLSLDEGNRCIAILEARAGQAAFERIAAAIEANGGVGKPARDFLFELRFADALAAAGCAFNYEVGGEGASTIDFGFGHGGHEWRVELVRFGHTDAAQSATEMWTDSDGSAWISQVFSSDAEDDRESEAGETLKAIERLCQKLERDGRAHKFPPVGEPIHVLLADVGAFLHGGDNFDWLHIALGAENVPQHYRQNFRGLPVTGVFHPKTRLRGASQARERLHFIGFVNDQRYEAGSFAPSTSFVANPNVVTDFAVARQMLAAWPLQPAALLNGRR